MLALVRPGAVVTLAVPPAERRVISLGYRPGVVPSTVAGGDAAVTFDPGDVERMRGAIEQLVSDRELRATMVARGRVHAAMFTWEKCASETLDAYRRAGAGG